MLDESIKTSVIIGVSAGASCIVIVTIVVSCVIHSRGCCKKRNAHSTDKDAESTPLDKNVDEENQNSSTSDNQQITTRSDKVPESISDDNASPETTAIVEVNYKSPSESSETPNQNGNITSGENDTEEERVVSVIYAKPDKTAKREPDASTNSNERKEIENEGKHSNHNSDLKHDKSTQLTSLDKGHDMTPAEVEALYSKPNKETQHTNGARVANSQDLELTNRDSLGSDYATIKETMEQKEPSRDDDDTPTYEDVKLEGMSPPVRVQPPRLPSDTLSRPPRRSSNDNNNIEPSYAEASVNGSHVVLIESSDDVFLPSAGKSKSLHHTPPYAQAQIVPRSQSARERQKSDNKHDEEPKVVLGVPGISKPSIKMPGTAPTELGIPDLDYPDYERVEIPNTSEILKPGVPPGATPSGAENRQSGWMENSIYSSVDDPNRKSAIDNDESPELVTYEQTNIGISSGSKEQSPERMATYEDVDTLKSDVDHEESPHLVTYEQTNIKKPDDADIIEDDYEEIRRSRFLGIAQVTKTQAVDGKDVPVTEL